MNLQTDAALGATIPQMPPAFADIMEPSRST
jgi:hypothetical protein